MCNCGATRRGVSTGHGKTYFHIGDGQSVPVGHAHGHGFFTVHSGERRCLGQFQFGVGFDRLGVNTAPESIGVAPRPTVNTGPKGHRRGEMMSAGIKRQLRPRVAGIADDLELTCGHANIVELNQTHPIRADDEIEIIRVNIFNIVIHIIPKGRG